MYDVHMISNSTIIRRIQYPTGVNRIGLNPLSGALLDVTPRQRELWSQVTRSADAHADYVETVIEPTEHDRGAHRDIVGETIKAYAYGMPPAHRDIVTDALDELFDPDGYPAPAHEDIFDTVVLPAITDADDINLGTF